MPPARPFLRLFALLVLGIVLDGCSVWIARTTRHRIEGLRRTVQLCRQGSKGVLHGHVTVQTDDAVHASSPLHQLQTLFA